jgi:hypothetical protein
VAKSREQRGARGCWRIREEWLQGSVGSDLSRSDDRGGVGKKRRFRHVAADGRDGREIVEGLVQGDRSGRAGFLGSDR